MNINDQENKHDLEQLKEAVIEYTARIAPKITNTKFSGPWRSLSGKLSKYLKLRAKRENDRIALRKSPNPLRGIFGHPGT